MLTLKTAKRVGRFLMGVTLFVAMAGPAMAGNVYSWVTEDGTYAFTDDPKRIPATYKSEAKSRPMGDLKRYGRYTVDRTGKGYTDRLEQRRADLRERSAAEQSIVTAAPATVPGTPSGLRFALPLNGGGSPGGHRGAQMQLGLGGAGMGDGSERMSVESVRMQPSEGQATRHFTIVKQGDRVVGVIKGENRDRSPEGMPESELDE